MVIVAQLVRAPGCGPGGRGFKSRLSPQLFFDLIFIFPNPNPFFLDDAFFDMRPMLEGLSPPTGFSVTVLDTQPTSTNIVNVRQI